MRTATLTHFVDGDDLVSLVVHSGPPNPHVGPVMLTVRDGAGLRGNLLHIYLSPEQLNQLVLDGHAAQYTLDDLNGVNDTTDPDSPNAP